MTCYYPKPAYYVPYTKINEKTGEIYKTRKIKFKSLWNSDGDTPNQENTVMIPCGKCPGCLIDRSNDYATRAMLETKQYPINCFVTLTYDNKHIPKNRSLVKKDIQNFLKRLRNHATEKLRFMCSGEYGPTTLRPHYHMLIWNFRPDDLKLFKKNITGDNLYTSKKLEKIWGKGYIIIGNVTYESAAYVARYVLKKAYGVTKNIFLKHGREPEFTLTSRRGGLGIGAFTNKAIWEQIKRNQGILIKQNNQIVVKKIPQYLREKWKSLDNREEYFNAMDARAREMKKNARTRENSKNAMQYLKQTIETLKIKIKKLDKRNNV